MAPMSASVGRTSAYVDSLPALRWGAPQPTYDVVIVGGGGHGLATAYYLATRHGITDVAVLEADYLVSGNTGRNTTIIRANYGIPEAVRFYQHSLDLYAALEDETGAGSCSRRRASSGWPTPRWPSARSARAACSTRPAAPRP